MSHEFNLKESYKMVVKKIIKDNPNQLSAIDEWTGMGSIKNINIGSTFQMLIPTQENKAKIFSTLSIEDVTILSSNEIQLIVSDGTVFRVEILNKVPPEYFN